MSLDEIARAYVLGVRRIEIEACDLDRATEFYETVWRLERLPSEDDVRYFRGSSAYPYILAVYQAARRASIRCVAFDVADQKALELMHARISATCKACELPHKLKGPAAEYGFGFVDPEGRNFALVCGASDGHDPEPSADRPRKIAHVNFNTTQLEEMKQFFCEILGFRVIDEAGPQTFLHCANTDHSSIVLCKGDRATLNHVAFEMPDLDSVMRGAGRMKEAGYPIQWGPGRHGAGNNAFCYFAGWEDFPLEYTAEVLQIDAGYTPHGPDYWRFPPGRGDQWGITEPHSPRWKRVQNLYAFTPGAYRL